MPPTEEDLAWFRSTFRPIPKPQLPDDTVEYSLYIFSSTWQSEDALRNRLREVQKAAAQIQKEYLKEYIWQRQAFGLEIAREDGLSLLRGRTEYGDSVEDEWVVVWLLRELTKQFKDLYAKICDNDGEFLLIEAAATLPEWLEPNVADNRVWIHDGNLAIIKPEHEGRSKRKKNEEKLDLQSARRLLLENGKRLLRSSTIEAESFYRLRNYPQQIMDNIHHTLLKLPRKAAYLLNQKPSYIAPAVEAFYLRDPISLKPLQNAESDDLTFSPSDLVTVSVAIPRVGYAQLKSQDFPATKAWTIILSSLDGSKEHASAETGMKISCGLEMLLSDSHYQDKPAVREMKMLLDDIDTGDETLPTDADISTWSQREDSEEWLDISFEDLENELGKKSDQASGGKRGEFGDKAAQENLQRIVAQFEKFLNDDTAGPDGAGLFDEFDTDEEDEDEDEDELNSDDDISEGEDKDVSFDEEQLSKMMREMMGMPTETAPRTAIPRTHDNSAKLGRVEELDSDDPVDDDPSAEDIEALSRQMEAELNESGALDLDPTPRKIAATRQLKSTGQGKGKGKGKEKAAKEAEEEDDNDSDDIDESNIDVNLARNLLESLKSQAGTAGPGGNMMGMMGFRMPRDEDDEALRNFGSGPSKK